MHCSVSSKRNDKPKSAQATRTCSYNMSVAMHPRHLLSIPDVRDPHGLWAMLDFCSQLYVHRNMLPMDTVPALGSDPLLPSLALLWLQRHKRDVWATLSLLALMFPTGTCKEEATFITQPTFQMKL